MSKISLLIIDQEEFDNRPKLAPEKKEAWLNALRSGDYKKGTNLLAQTGENKAEFHYCCLGVLCEVEKIEFRIKEVSNEKNIKEYSYQSKAYYPFAGETAKILGGNGFFRGFEILVTVDSDGTRVEKYLRSLTGVNDNTKTFEEVIEIIEKYF